ncbi:aminotransferase class I/II-fold pyridoxal phosphate-dependent enzyme [Streptomyces sp. NBC_01456]|uniref:aminotransferase class I/II-fold pyridoxal phosphate-dependent enzyme n=1 Tax=unclassified Streptomyces TaxID=2593676 RepID=UPI002E37299C|nr:MULTISPECIES: aminotransferase class I/II-fold pyridoxal phosphate-dependent enzyme [unclassified Streptomyces]
MPVRREITPPQAPALAFVRYHLDRPSLEIAHVLRQKGNVLVGAGAHFGVEQHLRITHGLEPAYLDAALTSITRVLAALNSPI